MLFSINNKTNMTVLAFAGFVLAMFVVMCMSFIPYISEKEKLEATYMSEVGVREKTGNNDGQDVEKYLASCGLGPGYAWCACFVNWVLIQNDIETPDEAPAWSPSWFPKEKTVYVRGKAEHYLPQRGDVGGLWYDNKKRIAHVLLIDDYDGTYFITVEGNTSDHAALDASNRDGQGVYRKRRPKRQIYAISRWKHLKKSQLEIGY